ncbi:hypothetical protein [Puniceicoccus vermicola]|uniref:Glycosyltransferase family 4 protein n=1 Tax=Puniceicoccus vermicola TaxID=388746 RepID=A0A7X1AWI3_9BACT|nr:hypothetical protein [Puniceicoccus vermicola]MBC2601089.1 hypothetical protein [Puniceicoccus vermicola]
MKILVPILRFNWYRTLAPVIDECLRRGHEVTCLHNDSERNFESNRPNDRLFPRFQHGTPLVDGYRNDDELYRKILGGDHEYLLSIDLPLREWIEDPKWSARKFQYVSITTPDTLKRLHDRETVAAVDCFALRTEYELEATILDRTTDYRSLYEEACSLEKDGLRYKGFVEPRLGKEWNPELVDEFRRKSRICGYPLLDALNLVDRDEFRKQLGVESGRPIIGFWATPTAGRGAHASWDWIFAEQRMHYFYAKAIRAYGIRGIAMPYVNEAHLVRSVYDFAQKNGAFLVTKLRHYQKPGESVYSTYTDRVLGEDCFYPHSAMSLAAVSDLMIGFTTSGTPEAVWSGSPVLDIEVPGSRRDLLCKSLHIWDGMLNHPGVVRSMTSQKVKTDLADKNLESFRFDAKAREDYMKKFCGPEGGGYSANVLDAVENLTGN